MFYRRWKSEADEFEATRPFINDSSLLALSSFAGNQRFLERLQRDYPGDAHLIYDHIFYQFPQAAAYLPDAHDNNEEENDDDEDKDDDDDQVSRPAFHIDADDYDEADKSKWLVSEFNITNQTQSRSVLADDDKENEKRKWAASLSLSLPR